VKYPQQIISWQQPVGVLQFRATTRAELYLIMTLENLFLFLPLGYYTARYVPSTFFSFKLFELQRLDQDGDGIPSYLEDLDGMVTSEY
jgi:hypothetical protein